jgi:hypothetical protein
MRNADTRLNNLRDLLHQAGLPPMTGNMGDDPTVVAKPALTKRTTVLVGKKWNSAFYVERSYEQFQASLGNVVRSTLMAKIRSANNLKWVPPLTKGQAIKTTLLNRLAEKNSNRRLVNVTLRVLDKWMGKGRRADVKVVIDGPDGKEHMYFAR